MRARLPKEKEDFFMQQLEEVCKNSRMLGSHKYMQHGNTSVFRHSVSVAYYSYYLALKMHAPVNETALIRGALLHDYFLMIGMRETILISGMDFIMQRRHWIMQWKILN